MRWRARRRARVGLCLSWLRRRSVSVVSMKLEGGEEGEVRSYLVSIGACQAAESRLHCAGGRVDVGLESGSVLVRHDCVCFVC